MYSSQTRVTEVKVEKRFTLLQMLDTQNLPDPYSFFRELRAYDPVYWDPYLHTWVVTSYREVIKVLTDYSAARTPEPSYLDNLGLSLMRPYAEMMQKQMMFIDGMKHLSLRAICTAAFTPRKVQELRGQIESIACELLDKVIGRESIDIVADFANPLPSIVTAKLLGFPPEDHQRLQAWVLDLAEVFGNFQNHPDRALEIATSLKDFKGYIKARIEEQREDPSGGLISSLMTTEIDGKRLSDEEIIANTILILIGGHETTTNLISSGFLTLLQEPDSLGQLKENPEIITSAVEELLRYESPVQHTARVAPTDSQLGNKTIRKGSRVVAVLAAANRDPNQFPDPDRLDLLRANNRHLAFGWASHFCFGAPLARLESQVAFNVLLRRLPNAVLVDSQINWRRNAGLRGPVKLLVGLNPNVLAAGG
jgi:pimeloyl-[acyl-carrier protein] synthase